jgi:hypothetical protein
MLTSDSQSAEIDEKKIVDAVKKLYKGASDFRFDRVGNQIADGNTYMVDFKTKELGKAVSWYYAYVDSSGCQLLKDGEEAIVFMQNLLDKRRSFIQRLKEFDLLDIIGAGIAFLILVPFAYTLFITKGTQGSISTEFLTIVSLILGYYFGRNKSK